MNQLIQGSEEWLKERSKRITSSDIACLMGCAAYGPRTLYDLWCHKVGLKSQEQTPAMRKGSEIEPIERARLSAEMGTEFTPDVIIDDWRMTSLDGLSPDRSIIIEIKSTGMRTFYDILEGKIPAHYNAQIQWHLSLVPEAKHCILSVVTDEQREQVEIVRDDAYIAEITKRAKDFYDNYLHPMIPPPNEKGDVALMDEGLFALEEQYLEAKKAKEEVEERMEHLYALIRERVGDVTKASGRLFSYSTTERAGIDYKQACMDSGLDLDRWKKPATKVFNMRQK